MTPTCEAASPGTARLGLTLLGDFQARLGAGPPLRLRTRKTQALLSYLGLPAGQAHSRDKVAALLWGELAQAQARSRLRETVFALRRTLAPADPPCLEVGSDTLALSAEAVDVDAVTFERLVHIGDSAALARAVDLYRGDLLEGLAFRGSAFEDWLMPERERLRELAVDAFAKLLAHQRSTGDADAALRTALRLTALDPLQEAVHRTLMRLYARLGRRGAALRQYQLCVGLLQRELGVEPEADTRQLYQDILRRRQPRPTGNGALGGESGPERLVPSAMTAAKATSLIGRDREVTRLRQLVERARGGTGGFVAIVGEAGVGKTRLASEIANEASHLDVRPLVGRCYESDQVLPFGPWVDALRTSGVTADEPLLSALAPPWRAELARLLPEVDVRGLPPPGDSSLRLFEGMAQVMRELAVRQPVILLLEDVHWADEMTVRLLAFVVRRVQSWRLLLVVTARDEELGDASPAHRMLQELGTQPDGERLTLLPLSRADTGRLAQALAGAGSSPHDVARLTEQVWAASEGNPFVAVETARALRDGSLSPNARALGLPERVRELIIARLGRLSETARELAAVAAVIGREFDFSLLQQAGGLEEQATAEGVEELVRRHVLRGVGERLDFSHDRVHSVVSEQMLPPLRKLRHRRIGAALEALHAHNLEPHYLALGTHFAEGEVWDKAVRYLRQACAGAYARSAYREAVAAYEHAIETLARLPLSREAAAESIDLRLELCLALGALAEWERARDAMRLAQTSAEMFDDTRRMGQVLDRMCLYLRLLGDHRGAIEAGRRALATAEAIADPALTMRAGFRLGQAFYATGHLEQSTDFLQQVVRTPAEDSDRKFLIGVARMWLAMSLAGLGQFDEAIGEGHRALRFAEARDDPYALVHALAGLALVGAARGTSQPVIEAAERGLAVARAWDIADGTFALSGALSAAHRLAGRADEAIRHGADAVESAPPGHRARCLVWLGAAYLAAGRSSDALAAAVRALDLSREQGERRSEAEALQLLGDIELGAAVSDFTAARINLEMALRLASELRLRPSVAHCHASLAKLYRQSGAHDQALRHYDTAIIMYRTMGMPFAQDVSAGSAITWGE